MASTLRSPVLLLSTAVAGAAVCFTAGFISSRVTQVLRNLAISSLEIRIPIVLPVTLAVVAGEILAGRRAVSSVTVRER